MALSFPQRSSAVPYLTYARDLISPGVGGPIPEVPDWPAEKVTRLPEHVCRFFRCLNKRRIDFDVPNRAANIRTDRTRSTDPSRGPRDV